MATISNINHNDTFFEMAILVKIPSKNMLADIEFESNKICFLIQASVNSRVSGQLDSEDVKCPALERQ